MREKTSKTQKTRPRRRFGQHFLEAGWVDKVVAAIAPRPTDTFVEIGPGRGALTSALSESGAHVVAIEIDRDLAALLRKTPLTNTHIVEADFLNVDLAVLSHTEPFLREAAMSDTTRGRGFRVVGNLPYNITSPILARLLAFQQESSLVVDATLMLQREVADRLTGLPGTRDYGVLGIMVQIDADVTRLLELPPGAFRPMPKVSSTLVRLTFRAPAVTLTDPVRFEMLVRTLFARRRKTLLNALKPFATATPLSAREALSRLGLDTRRRPETLQLSELARLSELFASAHSGLVL